MTYNVLQWELYYGIQWATMTVSDLQWAAMTYNELQGPT